MRPDYAFARSRELSARVKGFGPLDLSSTYRAIPKPNDPIDSDSIGIGVGWNAGANR